MRVEFIGIEPGSMVAAWSLRKPVTDVHDKRPMLLEVIDSGVLTIWSEDIDDYLLLRVRKHTHLPWERLFKRDELASTMTIGQEVDRIEVNEEPGRNLLADGAFVVMVSQFLSLWAGLMFAMMLITWLSK